MPAPYDGTRTDQRDGHCEDGELRNEHISDSGKAHNWDDPLADKAFRWQRSTEHFVDTEADQDVHCDHDQNNGDTGLFAIGPVGDGLYARQLS